MTAVSRASRVHPLRVAVIGTGHGAAVQIPAFQAHPSTSVTVVCSARLARAQAAAATYGIPLAADRFDDVVTRDDVDLVSIATPPPLHAAIAVAALVAGKHVICEKPLADDLPAAERMTAAAHAAPGCLAVTGFTYRFVAPRQQLRRLLDAGWIGDPLLGLVSNLAWRGSHAWNSQPGWLWDATAGGGFLGVAGPHSIDSARLWFGEARRVTARTHALETERVNPDSGERYPVTAEDSFELWIEYQRGASCHITSSMAMGAELGLANAVHGNRGSLSISGGRLLGARGEPGWEPLALDADLLRPDLDVLARQAMTSSGAYGLGSFLRLVDAVAQVLAGQADRTTLPSFDDGLSVQRVMDAARRAAATGSWIDLVAEPAGGPLIQ